MASERYFKFLLSDEYDPAGDSPYKFCQDYGQLAEHRDLLRNQSNAKEQTRAAKRQAEGQCPGGASAAASDMQGTRFSVLLDNDNGSTISPSTQQNFSANFTIAQLKSLTKDQRKAEVIKVKRDIEALKKEKKAKKDAAAAEAKEKKVREAAKKEKKQEEAEKEDQDAASELDLGQDWEKVNRAGKR